MEKKNLSDLINLCYEAVEESKLVVMIIDNPDGTKSFNNLPYQTFMSLIQNMAPKNFSGNMLLKEPGENWKKEGCCEHD